MQLAIEYHLKLIIFAFHLTFRFVKCFCWPIPSNDLNLFFLSIFVQVILSVDVWSLISAFRFTWKRERAFPLYRLPQVKIIKCFSHQ